MLYDRLFQEQELNINNLPVINGITWHIRHRGGERSIEFDLLTKLPIKLQHTSLELTETEVSIALNKDHGRLVFMMTAPDPASVSLPNWLPNGKFVSPSTETLIQSADCRLEDAIQPVLHSLRLVNDEQLKREAVNRNALAWLTAQHAFAESETLSPSPSVPERPAVSTAPVVRVNADGTRSVTMHPRPMIPAAPAAQTPVRHPLRITSRVPASQQRDLSQPTADVPITLMTHSFSAIPSLDRDEGS